MSLNYEQQQAFQRYRDGHNLFLTGSAGTGKSHVLRSIIADARVRWDQQEPDGGKRYVGVTAMTGAAACLIGGMTLHSFAGIGLGVKSTNDLVKKIQKKAQLATRWRDCKLLVIDEVSMLSSDLFDKIHEIACAVRQQPVTGALFGGVQLIACGDFAQLPPIEKANQAIKFAFESKYWQQYLDSNTFYLTQIIRQTDPAFQAILLQARMGQLTAESKKILKDRIITTDDFKALVRSKAIHPTILYPYRAEVDSINQNKLDNLIKKGAENQSYYPEYSFLIHGYLNNYQKYHTRAELTKIFGKGTQVRTDLLEYPPLSGNRGNLRLDLCLGAQVILTHNLDLDRGLANGSRGIITGFQDTTPIVQFDNGVTITLERAINVTEVLGADLLVGQYPLQLAWAQTIHKAQGQTISLVATNLSNCFSPGQAFVALSRGRTIEGSYLFGINFSNIKCHPKVKTYYQRFAYQCQWKQCQNSWQEYSYQSQFAEFKSCPKCFPVFIEQYFGHRLADIILKHLIEK